MYTIGEFSKLSHVSARMLRHYDALGLIHPNLTGSEKTCTNNSPIGTKNQSSGSNINEFISCYCIR